MSFLMIRHIKNVIEFVVKIIMISMKKRKLNKVKKISEVEKEKKPQKNAGHYNIKWWILGFFVFIVLLIFHFHHFISKTNFESSRKIVKKIVPDVEVPLPPSNAILKTFKHAAISSDSIDCSLIARNILQRGNIFDATIAIIICLSHVVPKSTGFGGGFLLNVYLKNENLAITVDSQAICPKKFNSNGPFSKGPYSIAVPGILKGLIEIYEKYGSLPWNEIVEPSIEHCANGTLLTMHLYDSLLINKDIENDDYLRDIFMENGKFKKPGSIIHMTKHCDFLKQIQNYSKDLYEKIAELIAKDLDKIGSLISLEDLLNYKVKWRDSLKFEMGYGRKLYVPETSPIVPMILNILKDFDLIEDFSSAESVNETILTYHRIVEAFKLSFAIRADLGDPDFIDVKPITNTILSHDFGRKIQQKINDDKTHANLHHYGFKNYSIPTNHGTSHVSIIDPEGNAVSITSSINYYFGSGTTGQQTGIIFNNAMDDFSYPTRQQNYFNLFETPTNYPAPHKRPLSSMTPAIVVNAQDQVEMVVGAAGGSKIISAVGLALIRYFWMGKDLKQVIDAPRFHHQLIPNYIEYEYGILEKILKELNRKNHKTKRYENRGTILCALTKSKENNINAINDYRKDSTGVTGY